LRIEISKVDSLAKLPETAYAGDAGLDLYSVEEVTLHPGQRQAVRTGIAVAVPEGNAGLVLPRSGLALKHGISLVNSPGLIDSGYRGEVKVLLLNTDSTDAFTVNVGDRVAQLLPVTLPQVELIEVTELSSTERGVGGFGSSGKQ